MNKKISHKTIALTFGVLVLLFAIGFYAFSAWTGPTLPPPDGNVAPPVTHPVIGANILDGTITIADTDVSIDQAVAWRHQRNMDWALAASDGSPTNAVFVNPVGNVGIGDTTPDSRLDVEGGDIRISTAGRGLIFPDGTKQTTAAVAGHLSFVTVRVRGIPGAHLIVASCPSGYSLSGVSGRVVCHSSDLRLIDRKVGLIFSSPGVLVCFVWPPLSGEQRIICYGQCIKLM